MSGGIAKKNIKLLLIVGGILIAVVSYFLGYKKLDEKTKSVMAQNSTIEQKLSRLNDIDRREDYEKDMVKFEQDIDAIIQKYPAEEREEDVILYAREMEKSRDLDVNHIGIMKSNLLYSLISSNSTAETEGGEVTTEGSSSVDAELGIKSISEISLPAVSLYSTQATYDYTVGYENIKACFADIYKHVDCRDVSSIALSYDGESGKLTGNMVVNLYYMLGTDRIYKEPDAGVMLHGQDDLFGTIGGDVVEGSEPEVQ